MEKILDFYLNTLYPVKRYRNVKGKFTYGIVIESDDNSKLYSYNNDKMEIYGIILNKTIKHLSIDEVIVKRGLKSYLSLS